MNKSSEKINIKAVIFDLDGTIYNTRGIQMIFSLYFITKLGLLLAFLKARKKLMGRDFLNQNSLRKEIIIDMQNKTGKSEEKCSKFIDSFMVRFVRTLKFLYKPNRNILEAIDLFYSNGIKVTCLSDYSKVEERLTALQIDTKKFTILASSEDAGALKPARRPFIEIAEKLNILPEQILVIGDRSDTDGEGAKNCNMYYIKYPENMNLLYNYIN